MAYTQWSTNQIQVQPGILIEIPPYDFVNGPPLPAKGSRPILKIELGIVRRQDIIGFPDGQIIFLIIDDRISYRLEAYKGSIRDVKHYNPETYPNKDVTATPQRLTFILTLNETNDAGLKCTYKTRDEYWFNFETEFRPIVTFRRKNATDEKDVCPSKVVSLFLKDNNLIIPSISIDFQSLIDGSDLGETIFEVTDEFQYYNHKTTPIIPNHICQILKSNDPKITRFEKACPLIVSVLRGEGSTAWDKVNYLFYNKNPNFDDIYNFFILGIVKYSMTKYLLSRIMYGNFNIKYILNKYHDKFLRDLSNTRFCNFVTLFTDPNSEIFGYQKYFK